MSVSTVTRTMISGSRSLVVALRQNSVVVPVFVGHDEMVLDRTALRVIEMLGAGASSRSELVSAAAVDTGVDEATVASLLDQLDARDLVLGAEPDAPRDVEVEIAEPPEGIERTTALVLPVPVVLRVTPDGFEYLDHEGRVRVRMSAGELHAAAHYRVPADRDQVYDKHGAEAGTWALPPERFEELTDRLLGGGLVVPYDPDDPVHSMRTRQVEKLRDGIYRKALVDQAFDRLEEECDARSRPTDLVPVLAIHDQWQYPPPALGVLVSYAKAYRDEALQGAYDFRPRLLYDDVRLEAAVGSKTVVALFSNYVWCHRQNMGFSALVKQLSPHSVTVHGGPNTPKFEGDEQLFFAENPHVDVIVRGEGEVTMAALLDALTGSVGDGPADLSVLGDVDGLSFRSGDHIIRTGERDRIADLDTIPSPVLTGLFDGFIPVGSAGGLSIETNRGCPYGCTFCDWGSATLSRIRKFDIDRVFAELEWCAKHEFGIGLTDANFGIFERDVDIAQRIADLKRTYGYPRIVGNNYAKNTVKHLSKIIELFTDAGIVAEGKMSMQSMDTGTLATIRRKNIKVEKYDDLSVEFSRNRLPLSVELMFGLPGATLDTLRNDLQDCVDRNVRAIVNHTVLLANSPMNDPEYRAENGIVARPGEVVKQTSTYTRDEWEQMDQLNEVFSLAENFGILRHVGMYVRAEKGIREIDFYERLANDVLADRERWPVLAVTYQSIPDLMVPPVSWRLFIDEIRTYLTDVIEIEDDAALRTVLEVQHALHPARERVFPHELELAHDYATWHRTVNELRRSGHRDDWPELVQPLRAHPPGSLAVEDRYGVCTTALGGTTVSLSWESMWDFVSPVSRPRQRIHEEPMAPIRA